MVNYQKARVKLANTQLNKLKSAGKNKTRTFIKADVEKVEDEELPHELFLRRREKTKTKKDFASNMSIDIKLSKAQMPKLIQSGGSFGSCSGNLGKKAPTNIDITLARDNLTGLVNNLTSSAINKLT